MHEHNKSLIRRQKSQFAATHECAAICRQVSLEFACGLSTRFFYCFFFLFMPRRVAPVGMTLARDVQLISRHIFTHAHVCMHVWAYGAYICMYVCM